MREGRIGRGDYDLVAALVAGPWAWEDRPRSVIDIVAVAMTGVGLAVVSVDSAIEWVAGSSSVLMRIAAVLLTLGASSSLLAPSLLSLGASENRWSSRSHVRALVIVRLVASVCLVGLWVTNHRELDLLQAWPFGLAAGGDAYMTLTRFGSVPSWRRLWSRVMTSDIHVGGLVGLLLITALGVVQPLDVLFLVLAWHAIVVAAVATVGLLKQLASRESKWLSDIEARLSSGEHSVRAQWLHDDVMAAIAATRMRLLAKPLVRDDVVRELDDLDHNLRIRQVDELLAAGPIRLADVIQPYVRRAQHLGLTVEGLPTHEVAGVLLDPTDAHRLRRVIGGAVSNAIKAASPTVEIRARFDGDVLTVEVEDAGGGFDLASVPVGSTLDRLRSDLGDSLRIERTERGTIVTAVLSQGRNS